MLAYVSVNSLGAWNIEQPQAPPTAAAQQQQQRCQTTHICERMTSCTVLYACIVWPVHMYTQKYSACLLKNRDSPE
jgi:hypothetical protein